MAGGKFSHPRPHRDEERQIEEAFRQVTGQAPKKEVSIPESAFTPQPVRSGDPLRRSVSQDTVLISEEEIRQTIDQVRQQSQTPREPAVQTPTIPSVSIPQEDLDLLSENPEALFDDLPPEDGQPDFIDKLLSFFHSLSEPGSKKQTAIALSLCVVSLLVIVVCVALFFGSAADPNDSRILDNVIIGNIDVGGMTKSEAIRTLKEATDGTYTKQDMVIDLSGNELRLSPEDTGARLDVKAAVNDAYNYGRTGTQAEKDQILTLSKVQPYYIGLLPYLDLDEDFILNTLKTYAAGSGSTLTQPTYGLEGREPELSAEGFNAQSPTQTLVITLGTPGISFDVNDVYEQVLDAYSLHTFLVTVENVESVSEPEAVDIEKIYEEFYIEPVDASVNLQTFETIPGSYGYGFDLEEAKELLANAGYGEILRIPMEYIAPDVLDANSFCQDILGEHQTRHTSNEDRNTNLRLACEAINGTVLDPGASFSFNYAVGQRTTARGYKSAPSDSSPNGQSTLGGGISQVSSTLYYAALLADLEITSRTANAIAPNYIELGMDAAVSWDLYDFTFRNNLGYPIQIEAEVTGGYVRVRIRGTEERSSYVLMDFSVTNTSEPLTQTKEFPHDNTEGYRNGDIIQEGLTGYTVKTYKIRYDRQTNTQFSRDYVGTTVYPSANKIVAVVLPEETTAPTTEATTVPTTVPPTTVPPTTVPPTTIAPTTEPPVTEPPVSDPTAPPETQAQEVSAVTEAAIVEVEEIV